MVAESKGGTQSLERAMSLLACFSDDHSELRVNELSLAAGLGQSTVSRMMSTLERLGFVSHDERTGLFRLGHAVVSLGSIALNQSPVFRASRQVAQNLAHRLELGANVAQRDGHALFYLCNFEGKNAPKSFSMSGRRAPLHATALGKALLLGLSEEELEEYLSAPLPAFTRHTITDRGALRGVLEEGRSNGYTTEIEELALGRACLAVPVRGGGGAVVAALSVSGPLSSVNIDAPLSLAQSTIEAADEISVALGFSPTQHPVRLPILQE